MKKFLFLFVFVALCIGFVACGNDDEPDDKAYSGKIESVYTDASQPHYTFDIDLNADSSGVYLYQVVFTIGERTSPAMNLLIKAPTTGDATGKIFTMKGTNIIPFMVMGNTEVPYPNFPVTDLNITVNMTAKTFDMFFRCHGGEYSDSGMLNL